MATLTSRLILSMTDRVTGPARNVGAALDHLNRRAAATSKMMLGGGLFAGGAVRNLMAVGAGYVGVTKGIGGTVGAAIKFEEAFADVRKVVDGTPGQLAQIRHEILAMSKTIPTSAQGIAEIYAAAGQSNIPINELGKFSEMVAKVAVAWEVSEGATSESLAKIKTQLNMNVAEIGLFADAVNHLGNNTAAAAPDLVDYSRRVAANGEMFGFASTETLAFGAAMVSTGAQSEVAATSFRNMGRALTIGTRATKTHQKAYGRLGLDAVKTAKNMQTNALETTLNVIDRISALPEWERISIASALFGDEARGLMPVISNSKELRRQLGLVGNEANYAGSSFEEYQVRAETTGNALQLLWNKFRAKGISIGESWLPTIKELSGGIGDVLDTLDKRIGVIDKVNVAFNGLLAGVGYGGTGGIREMMNDLGDLLFGEVFTGEMGAADERAVGLAKISNQFRSIGRDLKSFSDDIRAGNFGEAAGHIGDALSKLSGSLTVGGALALGVVGRGLIGIAAGSLALALSPIGRIATVATGVAALIEAVKGAESLGEFADGLANLSSIEWVAIAAGIAMLVGPTLRLGNAIKRIGGGIGGLFGGKGRTQSTPTSRANTGTSTPKQTGVGRGKISPWDAAKPRGPRGGPTGPHSSPVSYKPSALPGGFSLAQGIKGVIKGGLLTGIVNYLGEQAITAGVQKLSNALYTPEQIEAAQRKLNEGGIWSKEFWLGDAADGNFSLKDALAINADIGNRKTVGADIAAQNSNQPQDVSLINIPTVETKPTGTQDVRITNPMPAPIIHVTVNASTNASPAEIGQAAADLVGQQLRAASNAVYSDGGY